MNDLTPQAGPQGQPSLPSGHSPLESSINTAHKAARGQVSKLQDSLKIADQTRQELATLSALGDQVTPEDVIKGAGALVGKGADPMEMAGLLADMPQGGQALSSWLQQHEAKLGQNEQALQQQLGTARHTAAMAALHSLAMNHIGQAFGQGQPQPPAAAAAPPNNLETPNGG